MTPHGTTDRVAESTPTSAVSGTRPRMLPRCRGAKRSTKLGWVALSLNRSRRAAIRRDRTNNHVSASRLGRSAQSWPPTRVSRHPHGIARNASDATCASTRHAWVRLNMQIRALSDAHTHTYTDTCARTHAERWIHSQTCCCLTPTRKRCLSRRAQVASRRVAMNVGWSAGQAA